jgi:hypothetical protein
MPALTAHHHTEHLEAAAPRQPVHPRLPQHLPRMVAPEKPLRLSSEQGTRRALLQEALQALQALACD